MLEQDTPQGIGRLAAALAAVQAELKPAARSRKNTHLSSQYSTLEDIWDTIREPLARNGLAVMQTFEDAGERAALVLVTHLIHTSGEQVTSRLSCPIVVTKGLTDVQALGSAITYCRRYSLAAMVGVVSDEDDDGASTQQAPQQRAHEGNGRARATQAVQAAEQGTYAGGTVKPANELEAATQALFDALAGVDIQMSAKLAVGAVCGAALDRPVPKVGELGAPDRRAVAEWIKANPDSARAVAASAVKPQGAAA